MGWGASRRERGDFGGVKSGEELPKKGLPKRLAVPGRAISVRIKGTWREDPGKGLEKGLLEPSGNPAKRRMGGYLKRKQVAQDDAPVRREEVGGREKGSEGQVIQRVRIVKKVRVGSAKEA